MATHPSRAAARTGNPYEAIDATPGFPLSPGNIHLISTADSAATFRRDFEQLAGVRRGSEITWAMVEGLLIEHYFAPPTTVVDLFASP